MNIGEVLAKEHSRRVAARIADYVGNNKSRFRNLVDVFLKGPYRVTQRASWPLTICVERNPSLLDPHLSRILAMVKKDVHDAVKRNTVRMLQFVDVPARFQGAVTEICFGFLQDKKEAIAVRVFSMTVLSNIARSHPDLAGELRIIIQDQLPYGSAAFRSRARKILNR